MATNNFSLFNSPITFSKKRRKHTLLDSFILFAIWFSTKKPIMVIPLYNGGLSIHTILKNIKTSDHIILHIMYKIKFQNFVLKNLGSHAQLHIGLNFKGWFFFRSMFKARSGRKDSRLEVRKVDSNFLRVFSAIFCCSSRYLIAYYFWITFKIMWLSGL